MSADDDPSLLSPDTEQALRTVVPLVMPEESLAAFMRWWQLETWLRELVYVELRSLYGSAWEASVKASAGRQTQDAVYQHMSSADSDNPLAYLDYSQLLKVIEEHDAQLRYALLEPGSWDGRQKELIRIRHRIGHMRKPHADDVGRLEQTLRDLERGAYIACASYNDHRVPDLDEHSDPVTLGWIGRQHPTAVRLIDHAEAQYETSFYLSTSRRPWATYPDDLNGAQGVLWHASFIIRGDGVDLRALWREVRGLAPMLVHLVANHPNHVSFTFSAVDDGTAVADAIGVAFDAVLHSSRHGHQVGWVDEYEAWQRRARQIDFRILSGNLWGLVDEGTIPISIFGAGGGVEFAPEW